MKVSLKAATAGTAAKISCLLLMLVLVAAPLNAQRGRQPAPKAPPKPPVQATQPAPTFETVLAADSYKIYGEVRGVGQLLRSGGVNDILDPLVKLAAPPKEFKTLVRWLNTQADALMTSRLMFAVWPSRPNLPSALFVIEFDSAEEAQKFEPQLKEFLPKFLPTPVPEGSPSLIEGKKGEDQKENKHESPEAKPKATPPPGPQFMLKQSGALVFISVTPFTLKTLRPTGSKLLAEDPNFRQVHNRFSSESVFLYFDVTAIEKEEQDRMRQWEENERKRLESEAANPKKAEDGEHEEPDNVAPVVMPPEGPSPELGGVGPPPRPQPDPGVTLAGSPQVTVDVGTSGVLVQGEPQNTPPSLAALSMLSGVFFTGRPKWPEAIGVAIAFDADSYVVRALLVNSPGVKGNAIPFIPQLVSGPALTPEASSILPADTEMLVTLSLDYPLMYEGMVKAMTREPESGSRGTRQTIRNNQPESPFAAYEAKLGIKIKEDLLPLLGNEIALSVPVKTFGISPPQPSPSPSPSPSSPAEDGSKEKATTPSEPSPVVAISVRDREAIRILMPKMIDSLGFKGASLLAQTEKRDDTELVSYAGVISYAFIGNFLIVSPDTNSVRHVVDSYLKHQTLASDSSFRNHTRWQPRQVLGQVYVSPALMGSYDEFAKQANSTANDKLRDFLSRLSPTPEPVTYALSNEGLGPLHELHVPKNLVMFMIAGIASETNQPPVVRNEAIAQSALRMISSAEATYQSTAGNGNYGTLDQLIEQGLVPKDLLQDYGYKIEVTVGGSKFEATAVPLEYDKTGRRSFFIDESAVLRGADNGGSMATVADAPVP